MLSFVNYLPFTLAATFVFFVPKEFVFTFANAFLTLFLGFAVAIEENLAERDGILAIQYEE